MTHIYQLASDGARASIPELALSVRQPWATAIVMLGKNIENRSWQAVNHGLTVRGRIAIHAAKGMTRDEYEDAADFMARINVLCPLPADLPRGAIIGSVEVIDVVKESDSPWFFGPRGLVLRNPEVWTPIPCKGALGYFKWHSDYSLRPEPAAKWMLDQTPKSTEKLQNVCGDMFASRSARGAL